MPDTPDRRLLLVHAHPDDETINNGATMAKYVDDGAGVTLVTCTAGEMGEVLVPELGHLAAEHDDALGPHRREELAAAMRVLGVTDHRFLGGFGAFRDSGHEVARGRPRDPRRRDARRRVLERRPHRGRRPPRRGDPRGPAAGAGHLRPVRRLRPPRPHPGPPRRDVRRHPGRGPVLPARPRASPGTSRRSTGRRCRRSGCATACGRCARPATPRPSRAWTPTATCRPSSPRTR